MRITCLLLILAIALPALAQKSIPVELHRNSGKKKLFSKAFNAEEYYENGNLRVRGAFLKCTTRDPHGHYDIYESRKIGKWMYYHSNGKIARIENYSRYTNCSETNFKSGKWQYFNEQGILYFEEEYALDTLVSSSIDIFRKSELIGQYITKNGIADTLFIGDVKRSENLIPNADFESYKFKPIPIVNTGQNTIEELIPDWSSPDGNTPDYYNYNRGVNGVYNVISRDPIQNGFVGLVLFHDESDRYLEHIQTKLLNSLDSGMRYCFKMKIRLSQNAGYTIDHFGVRLFKNKVGDQSEWSQDATKIDFRKTLDQPEKWLSLCTSFTAQGGEQFLVLGRFANIRDVNVNPVKSKYVNKLDVNRSAYYLVDDINLFTSVKNSCQCEYDSKDMEVVQAPDDVLFSDLLKMENGDRMFLNNIFFETNRADLLESSFDELEILRSFLMKETAVNFEIRGHTDNVGSEDYNEMLSMRRAESVKNWLVSNGVSGDRLTCMGLGFSDPAIDNSSETNRRLNRRVEIVILK